MKSQRLLVLKSCCWFPRSGVAPVVQLIWVVTCPLWTQSTDVPYITTRTVYCFWKVETHYIIQLGRFCRETSFLDSRFPPLNHILTTSIILLVIVKKLDLNFIGLFLWLKLLSYVMLSLHCLFCPIDSLFSLQSHRTKKKAGNPCNWEAGNGGFAVTHCCWYVFC